MHAETKDALLDQLWLDQFRLEQAKGLGRDGNFGFTSASGRPLSRHRLSESGVAAAARARDSGA
jgi:hypothetical protein